MSGGDVGAGADALRAVELAAGAVMLKGGMACADEGEWVGAALGSVGVAWGGGG